MEDVYTGPIEFQVVFKNVVIRRKPDVGSKHMAVFNRGDVLKGYPRDGWVRLEQRFRNNKSGWCKVDGTDLGLGALLQTTALKGHIVKAFAEAVYIYWEHLPAKVIHYTVEWTTQDDRSNVRVAVKSLTENVCKVGGLFGNRTHLFRVTAACIYA